MTSAALAVHVQDVPACRECDPLGVTVDVCGEHQGESCRILRSSSVSVHPSPGPRNSSYAASWSAIRPAKCPGSSSRASHTARAFTCAVRSQEGKGIRQILRSDRRQDDRQIIAVVPHASKKPSNGVRCVRIPHMPFSSSPFRQGGDLVLGLLDHLGNPLAPVRTRRVRERNSSVQCLRIEEHLP